MYIKLFADDVLSPTICLYGYITPMNFKNKNAHILVSEGEEYLIYIFKEYVDYFAYYKDYYFMIVLGTRAGGGVPYVFSLI